MTTPAPTVADLAAYLDQRFPPKLAESWDKVGLVLGDPGDSVRRVLLVIDVVPETAAQAIEIGAQLIVAHHPLLLRPVSSIASTTYKGRIIHQLIRAGIALFTTHTNADVANPGVSDALAARLGLTESRPLRPSDDDPTRGAGRIGRLPTPLRLAELAELAAARLPATRSGVRAAGDPDRLITTLAVCGGAGDSYLADARAAGVDGYLTADLRHHPASEFTSELDPAGPALLDAAHWATEQPWLAAIAEDLRRVAPIETIVSDLVTDPWTVHARPGDPGPAKEPSP